MRVQSPNLPRRLASVHVLRSVLEWRVAVQHRVVAEIGQPAAMSLEWTLLNPKLTRLLIGAVQQRVVLAIRTPALKNINPDWKAGSMRGVQDDEMSHDPRSGRHQCCFS